MTQPMPMCPMAGACKNMIEKPHASLMMSVPGIVLIMLGIAVIIEPRILVWLVAFALIMMGIAALAMNRFMGNVARGMRSP